MTTCIGCGINGDDWTPGCRACVSRHYKRALRSHDPEAIVSYRKTARAHFDAAVQERAQRQRDGLLEPWWLEQERGNRGRWVTA